VTIDEARELAAAVRRVCPDQEITDLAVSRWPSLLHGLRLSECLVAVGLLGCFQARIEPANIAAQVRKVRRNPVEPGGKLWADNLAAHGGQEYTGGPVPVWDTP
jgi:hypothetical protein